MVLGRDPTSPGERERPLRGSIDFSSLPPSPMKRTALKQAQDGLPTLSFVPPSPSKLGAHQTWPLITPGSRRQQHLYVQRVLPALLAVLALAVLWTWLRFNMKKATRAAWAPDVGGVQQRSNTPIVARAIVLPAAVDADLNSLSSPTADLQASATPGVDCAARIERLRPQFDEAWVCQAPIANCFQKCPGGRWVNNGWLDVDTMLPLMTQPYRDHHPGIGVEHPFVYLDVGCKLAEEAVLVLDEYKYSNVVALEMRPEFAAKCEANARARAAANATVTVLNKAAALAPGSGTFALNRDSSSIRPQMEEPSQGRTSHRHEQLEQIEFVTLQSTWEEHLAPKKVNLLKIDAEGWDGLILRNGTRGLLERQLIEAFIFEYHGHFVKWHGELQDYVTTFWEWGYTCFHITCAYLYPLTPPSLWLPNYEYRAQGNVFCALPGPFLSATYDNYYGDPGVKDTFEARKTEPQYSAPGKPMTIPTNYTGFVADYGDLLRDHPQCLNYQR